MSSSTYKFGRIFADRGLAWGLGGKGEGSREQGGEGRGGQVHGWATGRTDHKSISLGLGLWFQLTEPKVPNLHNEH